jgi:hypothetical protein
LQESQERKGSETMSMQEYVRSYTSQVSEQETMFRDLFGKEEFEEVRKKGFAQRKPYLQYLKEETERKLKEQDGETDEWGD